jgi:hypothetical protein
MSDADKSPHRSVVGRTLETYCLYEARSGDAIREAARLAGLPADIVMDGR